MQKLFTLVLVVLFLLTYACHQKEKTNQEEAVAVDTTEATEGIIQVSEENIEGLPLTYAQKRGKRLYNKYCAICHGLEGKGDGFNAYNLDPKPKDITGNGYLAAVTDAWLVEAISQGGRGVKRSVLMPSYENTLSKNQIEDIVAYLRYLAK